jgi:dipeptidase D
MFKKEAKVEAIHAGLECGIIGEKFPGMDMVSIGPTIKYPHSPDEQVYISTVKKFYDYVVSILENV